MSQQVKVNLNQYKSQKLVDYLTTSESSNKLLKRIPLSQKSLYFRFVSILLLEDPHTLIKLIKEQINEGLTADKVLTLKLLSTYLNECINKGLI